MADITLEQMLQAGVHFGHQTKYWNPKMDQYLFGTRDKIHIINLEHTVEMIKPALKFIEGVAAKNNKILEEIGIKYSVQPRFIIALWV